MDCPRDLFLNDERRLCEADDPRQALLFHRKGQTITPLEEATYAVSAYLERTSREGERAERQRIVAQAKAVEFAEVENKALAGPDDVTVAPVEEPMAAAPQENPENPIPPVRSESPDVRRTGGGRRG